MKAMVIEEFGGPDKLRIRELALPEPVAGEVRIRVKAFGLNRAETYMRRGLWAQSHRYESACAGSERGFIAKAWRLTVRFFACSTCCRPSVPRKT
jgi:NADPH:quinone reductase-like Zn-dependent oxidoreductase